MWGELKIRALQRTFAEKVKGAADTDWDSGGSYFPPRLWGAIEGLSSPGENNCWQVLLSSQSVCRREQKRPQTLPSSMILGRWRQWRCGRALEIGCHRSLASSGRWALNRGEKVVDKFGGRRRKVCGG